MRKGDAYTLALLYEYTPHDRAYISLVFNGVHYTTAVCDYNLKLLKYRSQFRQRVSQHIQANSKGENNIGVVETMAIMCVCYARKLSFCCCCNFYFSLCRFDLLSIWRR